MQQSLQKHRYPPLDNSRIQIVTICFSAFVQIVFFRSTLAATYSYTQVANLVKAGEWAIIALLMCTIVVNSSRSSKTVFTLIVFSATAFIITMQRARDSQLILDLLILLTAASANKTNLFKSLGATTLISTCLVMTLSVFGLLGNRDYMPNGFLVFSYGFGHPNETGALLFSSLCALTYAYWEEKRWLIVAVLSSLTALFVRMTLSSHATCILCLSLAAFNLVGHMRCLTRPAEVARPFWKMTLISIPLVLLAGTIYLTVRYNPDNPLMQTINHALHGRPHYAHNYYVANGGFTVFGSTYDKIPNFHTGIHTWGVDSGYAYLPSVYGLLSLCASASIYIAAIIRTNNSKGMIVGSLLLLNALYLLVESYPLFFATSTSLLFLSDAFLTPAKAK